MSSFTNTFTFGLTAVFLAASMSGCTKVPEDAALQSDGSYMQRVDFGAVEKVENCKSSKYSLHCDVTTDKYVVQGMDITQFPKQYVQKGDNLSYTAIFSGALKTSNYGQNGDTVQRGNCLRLDSCSVGVAQFKITTR